MERRTGLIGAAVGAALGVAAAGVAAAVVAEKTAIGRVRRADDPERDEPFGTIRGRPLTVLTDDGAPLHVEIDDGPGPLTVIFVHGWALNGDSFHYQRRDLRGVARLVCYDQRGHGRSGDGRTEKAEIDRLGTDLRAVIDAVTPDGGPVVLVGHSMGGMTILSLAGQHPEMFGDRIRGVALIGTSAGRLSEVTLGLPPLAARVVSRSTPVALAALGRMSALVDRGRAAGGDVAFLIMRYFGFGDHRASPTVISFAEATIRTTPMDVIARWYPALMTYDRHAALPVLDRVPVLVVAGTRDRLTPPEHAEAIVAAVPSADLLTIAGCGHLIMLEQPALVNRALRGLIRRAAEPMRRD